jgi:hypothetical protein
MNTFNPFKLSARVNDILRSMLIRAARARDVGELNIALELESLARCALTDYPRISWDKASDWVDAEVAKYREIRSRIAAKTAA